VPPGSGPNPVRPLRAVADHEPSEPAPSLAASGPATPTGTPAGPGGAASRFARSMMELVVGAPHVDTAERVVSAGTSIVEFVGAPVRRVFEPAIDNRAEAAQDALVALLELTRTVVQEAVEIVDLNAVLDRIDLNGLLRRIDINELIRRVDVSEMIDRVDVDEMIRRVDVDEIIRRVDIAEVLRRVDINALMEQVDINELMKRVDIEALINRVDINQLMDNVDIDGIVERTEIGSLVVRSTTGVATEALDAVRRGTVGVDTTLTRVVNRVLRRKPGPAGPGLVPEPSA
jgi:hypothetical protein